MAVTTDNFEQVAPAALLSTNSYVALAPIDTGPWKSLAYTIAVITNAVTWEVYGTNASDYSDEQIVQAGASVGAGATGTYAVAQAVYRYYRVKIKSTVGGAHGTATVRGIAKAS
jgi:20S proteasome alpha/beta subunit